MRATQLQEKAAQIRLTQARGTALINMAVAALIIAALYFGREIFVPVALAVLLSFVLAPFVIRLHSWRIPRTASVLIVVFFGFAIIFSLGGLMVSQATHLAAKLPAYQQTLSDKVESLRGLMGGSGTLEQASTVLKELGTQLQHGDATSRSNSELGKQASDRAAPIAVEVKQPDPGALTTLAKIIEPLLSPLTTTGIVVIFVAFILLQREDLRNRLVRLAGSGDIQRTTAALDDAGKRLSKLFLTQIIFNAVFGLAIGIGLELIGVPSAPLWGLIAMILRFVPYIGALISAIFPLILAAAVGSGWEMVVLTALLFAALELLAGQVIEPLIYGHSSGLSPVAIILSASFWTWLWGPVGLVMATPLTVCLVVAGRHVERLKFLEIMLGDRPPLKPPQLIYQRMLAGDPVEAAEQARDFLKGSSLTDYCDTILLEGIEARRGRPPIGSSRRRTIEQNCLDRRRAGGRSRNTARVRRDRLPVHRHERKSRRRSRNRGSKGATQVDGGKRKIAAFGPLHSRIRKARRSGGAGVGLFAAAPRYRSDGGGGGRSVNVEVLFARHDGYRAGVCLLRRPTVPRQDLGCRSPARQEERRRPHTARALGT